MSRPKRQSPGQSAGAFSSPASPEDDGREPARGQRPPAPDVSIDRLPPHSIEDEQGVLGCCLISPYEAIKACDERGVRNHWFYDLRHADIWGTLIEMHRERSAVDLITVQRRLKDDGELEQVGGVAYLSSLMDLVPSAANLGYYLDALADKAALRKIVQTATNILGTARERPGDVKLILDQFRHDIELASETSAGTKAAPLIEMWGEDEIRAHVKDPENYLVGDSLIKRGEWSVLAGWWGLGKSRAANWLGIAGARGSDWMGYATRRKIRTFVLQSENDEDRIQDELLPQLNGTRDWFRISRPTVLNFRSDRFIAELKALFQAWPFDLLEIDPWTDVAGAAEMEDVQLAMMRLLECFQGAAKRPAILCVAHTRKQKGGESWKPKRPSEMVHEIAGSYGLVAKARTVMTLQPHSLAEGDDRVVFGVGKSNNQVALPMSCWHRKNGEFTPAAGFDSDAWLNPPDAATRRREMDREDLVEAFGKRAGMPRHELIEKLKELGHKQSTIYRAIGKGGYLADELYGAAGIVSLRKE